jgi:hypothetical protein
VILLLNRFDAVPSQFSLGALTDVRLPSQRFSANAILTGLANTAVEYRRRLAANHAFLLRIAHDDYFTRWALIANLP